MSDEYTVKLEKLKKYVPTLDAWLIRLKSQKKNEHVAKIEQLRAMLTNKHSKFGYDSILKCEYVLGNLESKLGGAEDPHLNPPLHKSEMHNLDESRAKLRKVTKELTECAPSENSETSNSKVNSEGPKSLYERRSTADDDTNSRYQTPSQRNFTRVLRSPGREDKLTHSNSPLYERRQDRDSSRSISPRCKRNSSSSRSRHDDRYYNKKINIDLESFNLGNSDDVLERILACKDDDADINRLRSARARIMHQLKEIVPETEIPGLLLKKYKRKKKKMHRKVDLEEGELSASDSEIINMYSNLDVEFNHEPNHDNKHLKSHRTKTKINITLTKPVVVPTVAQSDGLNEELSHEKSNEDHKTINDKETRDENRTSNKSTDKITSEMKDKNNTQKKKEFTDKSTSEIKVENKTEKKSRELTDKSTSETKVENKTQKKSREVTDKSTSENKIENKTHKKSKELTDKSTSEQKDENKIPKKSKNNIDVIKSDTLNSLEKSDLEASKYKQDKTLNFSKNSDSSNLKHHEKKENRPKKDKISNTVFSKEIVSQNISVSKSSLSDKTQTPVCDEKADGHKLKGSISSLPNKKETPNSNNVSEIDILTALKNEILDTSDSKKTTNSSIPEMHKPKIITKIKDSSILESERKKRISIDMYKQKSDRLSIESETRSAIFDDEEKRLRKTLTDKEFQRFQTVIPDTIQENICDPETQLGTYNKSPVSPVNFMQCNSPKNLGITNSCPKSPEHEERVSHFSILPKIIPTEPVKLDEVPTVADVDFRISSSAKSLVDSVQFKSTQIITSKAVNQRHANVLTYETTPKHNPFEVEDSSLFDFRPNLRLNSAERAPPPIWEKESKFLPYENVQNDVRSIPTPHFFTRREQRQSIGQIETSFSEHSQDRYRNDDRRNSTFIPNQRYNPTDASYQDRNRSTPRRETSFVSNQRINKTFQQNNNDRRDSSFLSNQRDGRGFSVDIPNRYNDRDPRAFNHSIPYSTQNQEKGSYNYFEREYKYNQSYDRDRKYNQSYDKESHQNRNDWNQSNYRRNDLSSNAPYNRASIFSVDPRKGRNFYNTDKITMTKTINKPNPGYSRENDFKRGTNIDYIRCWQPKDSYLSEERNRKFERAQSVGRELISSHRLREGSVGRNILSAIPRSKDETLIKPLISFRPNFSRSKSVGPKTENSKYDKRYSENNDAKPKESKYSYNKDKFGFQRKSPSSSKETIRERRDFTLDNRKNSKYERYERHYASTKISPRKSRIDTTHAKRTQGIVYSNDNIARGKAITPGFGVKNYKIPKIKKPDEPPALEKPTSPNSERSNSSLENSKLKKHQQRNDINEKVKCESITKSPKHQNSEKVDRDYNLRRKSNRDQSTKNESKIIGDSVQASDIELTTTSETYTTEKVLEKNNSSDNSGKDSYKKITIDGINSKDTNTNEQSTKPTKSVLIEQTNAISTSETCNEDSLDSFTDETLKTQINLITESLTLSPNKESLETINSSNECKDSQEKIKLSAVVSTKSNKNSEIDKNLNSENSEKLVTSIEMEACVKESSKTENVVSVDTSVDEKEITSSCKNEEIISNKFVEGESNKTQNEITEDNLPDSTENSQEKSVANENDATTCIQVADSTDGTENQQQLDEKNTNKENDNKENTITDEVKNFLAILKDPSKLMGVLPQLPSSMRQHLINFTQMNAEQIESDKKTEDADEKKSVGVESNKEELIEDVKNDVMVNENTSSVCSDKFGGNVVKGSDEQNLNQSNNAQINETIPDTIPIENDENQKQEVSKRKSVRELDNLHENLKEFLSSSSNSIIYGMRSCRLTQKTQYCDNIDKGEERKSKIEDDIKKLPLKPLDVLDKSKSLENKRTRKKRETKCKQNHDSQIATVNEIESRPDTATPVETVNDQRVVFSIKRRKGRKSWKKKKMTKEQLKKQIRLTNTSKPDDPYTFIDSQPDADNNSATVTIEKVRPFIEVDYHFKENETSYPCKLCNFVGDGIVYHYRKEHPTEEVLISRLDYKTAVKSRQQAICRDFETIKNSQEKFTYHVCRFCFQEFDDLTTLESLFWHVVSTHTGEYKNAGANVTSQIIVPSPPKDSDNLLLGYMCSQCYFTQICFENLINHVIANHSKDEVKVFHISLSDVQFKKKSVLKPKKISAEKIEQVAEKRKIDVEEVISEEPTKQKKVPKLVQKITFEEDLDSSDDENLDYSPEPASLSYESEQEPNEFVEEKLPVFELSFQNDGSKSYLCKIKSCTFNTSLQISFKKHVQVKHKSDKWNGSCQFCELEMNSVSFADYANHFVKEHLEPVNTTQKESEIRPIVETESTNENDATIVNKNYIQVRPISDLLPIPEIINTDSEIGFPVIESVVSLNSDNTFRTTPLQASPPHEPVAMPHCSDEASLQSQTSNCEEENFNETALMPSPDAANVEIPTPFFIYNEKIATVTSTMTSSKMAQIFKCAGKFCSFTSTTPEPFVEHIISHLKVQMRDNSDVTRCVYCAFSSEDASYLASHIFSEHAFCGYGCVQCFFISVSAAIVEQHYRKEHTSVGTILKMHEVNTDREMATRGKLPKNEAAPDYFCPIDENCDHKLLTAAMLVDHLKQNHPNVRTFKCRECLKINPSDMNFYANSGKLISHLKSHGYALYQCAFCFYGAMKLDEILLHFVISHPNRKPQTYLRFVDESISQTAPNKGKHVPIPIINLDKEKEVLKVASGPEESPSLEVERALKLENSILGVNFQRKPDIAVIQTQSLVDNNVICLDSDEEILPETSLTHIAPVIPDTEEVSKRVSDQLFYTCGLCNDVLNNEKNLRGHYFSTHSHDSYQCAHCLLIFSNFTILIKHMESLHRELKKYRCEKCGLEDKKSKKIVQHMTKIHKVSGVTLHLDESTTDKCKVYKIVAGSTKVSTPKIKKYGPDDIALLPTKPIFDQLIYCARCEFHSKVRSNMIRHLQQHKIEAPTPSVAPVNPVPHLETNEMYFDKMTNLASSSHTVRLLDKMPRPSLSETELSRYPRFIPHKERLACGAAGCSYISLDEGMLRRHWDALHANTPAAATYRCVHCPSTQRLDTSKPLTASRIVAHLRMHDERLYACSGACCYYYHHQKHIVEKHVAEKHNGEKASVFALREPNEEVATSTSILRGVPTPSTSSAPTMDLKKWKCGICDHAHPLRSEVLEHVIKSHGLTDRYRCSICPYSNILKDNIENHARAEHSGLNFTVIFAYYQEGTVKEEVDGKPLWQYQREIFEKSQNEVKCEISRASTSQAVQGTNDTESELQIDLPNIKQEEPSAGPAQMSPDQVQVFLYGQPGAPLGVKFLCPICKIYANIDKTVFADHLYEEVGYRSWCCELCTYRAYTENRLKDHLNTEHGNWHQSGKSFHQIQDSNIESWIALVIKTQETLISSNTRDLALNTRWLELKEKFGPSCEPKNGLFACPRCPQLSEDRALIEDHLMRELEIFTWGCSGCPSMFHYCQHAKEHAATHSGPPRPISKVSTELKKEWIKFAVEYQVEILKKNVSYQNEPDVDIETLDTAANDLLVVRKEGKSTLVPDAPAACTLKPDGSYLCPFCTHSTPSIYSMKLHVAPHLNMKPYRCTNCPYMAATAKTVKDHVSRQHPNDPTAESRLTCSEEYLYFPPKRGSTVSMLICLECEEEIEESDKYRHLHVEHQGRSVPLVGHGAIAPRCGACKCLQVDIEAMREHYRLQHAQNEFDYTMVKAGVSKESVKCDRCGSVFPSVRDFRCHNARAHPGQVPSITKTASEPPKKKLKMSNVTARKSTSRLPSSITARKSTARLPLEHEVEYSFYGSDPPPREEFENIVTHLSIGGSEMPFKLGTLGDMIQIDPKVVVKDINKSKDST